MQSKGNVADYELVSVISPDFSGIPRGRFVTSSCAETVFSRGLGFYSIFVGIGPRNEMTDQLVKLCDFNGYLVPDISTLHSAPWRSNDVTCNKWGEVIGDYITKDGSSPNFYPRTVAKLQLEKLRKMGFSCFAATEHEFFVAKENTQELYPAVWHIYSPLVLSDCGDFIADCCAKFKAAGIVLESFEHEVGPGQFEFNLQPEFGIKSADNSFVFRSAIKQIARHHKLDVSFMTQPYEREFPHSAAGAHHNLSLWKDGANVFDYNDNGQPNALLRHWLGGLCKHSAELNLMTSPTINCYRRLHATGTPGAVSWRSENRHAAFRVVKTNQGAYVESRMPSGAANPYLTLAATLAAGMDGLANGIEPPAEGVALSQHDIPTDYRVSVSALRTSEFARRNFGDQFIDLYCKLKEKELESIGVYAEVHVHKGLSEEEAKLAAERDEYFRII